MDFTTLFAPHREPSISVNGYLLTYGQALCVRVAVTAFMDSMLTDGLGDDRIGVEMAASYRARCKEVLAIMGIA